MDQETTERCEKAREADETLQAVLRERLEANRFVLTAEGRIVRAEHQEALPTEGEQE
jgi:hypothetical protein